jgi:hypothetical protein
MRFVKVILFILFVKFSCAQDESSVKRNIDGLPKIAYDQSCIDSLVYQEGCILTSVYIRVLSDSTGEIVESELIFSESSIICVRDSCKLKVAERNFRQNLTCLLESLEVITPGMDNGNPISTEVYIPVRINWN